MKNLLKLKDYMNSGKFDLQYFMMLVTELDEGQYDVLIHHFNEGLGGMNGWFCNIHDDNRDVEDRLMIKVLGCLTPSQACKECYELFIEELDRRGFKN